MRIPPKPRRRPACPAWPVHALALAAAGLWATGATAAPSRHAWTDWFSEGGGVDGRLAIAGTNVGVRYEGPYHSAVLSATFQEMRSATFTNSVIANAPPNTDVINLQGGAGRGQISFSQALINPVMSILSLGLRTNGDHYFPAEMVFADGVRFEVLNSSSSFYGYGGPLTQNGQTLRGLESAGSIRFIGAYDSISWTTPLQEREFSGGPIGGSWHINVGAPCDNIDIGAGPLRMAATVLRGCTATNSAAAWQQDAALTVHGRYTNVGRHTLAADLTLGATATYANTGQVAIDAGRTLDVGAQTYVDIGRTDVSGTLDLHSANLQVAGLVRVLAGGRLLVTGTGASLLGGDIQLGGAGATMRVLAPTTLYGSVTAGDNSVFELAAGVPLSVTDGGRLVVAGTNAILSNNGQLTFLGGRLDVNAGNFQNNAQLLVQGGAPLYVTGGLLRNAAGARIQTNWQIAVGAGADTARLVNDGQVELVGAQGQLSAFYNGSFAQGASGRLLAGAGSVIEVTAGGTATLGGITTVDGNLQIESGGRLEVIGGGTLRQNLKPGSTGRNGGDLVNLGVLQIDSALQASPWVNDGTLDNGNQFELFPGTGLVNRGLIVNRAFMTVGGFLEMAAGSQLVQHGGSLVINGRLTGGRIASGDPLTIAAGRLMGTGEINGDVVILGGAAAAPGRSPGTLRVLGDMVLGSGSTLALEMARDGRHDLLQVDGRLTIDPGANVRLSFPGGAPDVDQTFAVLSVGGIGPDLGAARLAIDHPTLQSTAYNDGRTLALAFQEASAQHFDLRDGNDVQFDAGQTYYSDSDLGYYGRVGVGGTLGLRASAALLLGQAEVAAGGRLLNSGRLFVGSSLANDGETTNRGSLTLVGLANRGVFVNRGDLAIGWPGDPSARLVNQGSFQHLAGTLTMASNDGDAVAVDNAAGAELRLAGSQSGRMALRNQGRVEVDRGGLLLATTVQQDSGELWVDGELDAQAIQVLGGVLGGTGVIGGELLITDAAGDANGLRPGTRLRPGLAGPVAAGSAGPGGLGGQGGLQFTGPVHLAAVDQGVVIEIDIASAEAFGQLRFLGGLTVDIGTRLQVVLIDGFLPDQPLLLPLMYFDPLQTDYIGLQYLVDNTSVWQRQGSGDAPWLAGSWALALQDDRMELSLTPAPVPEPATWGLLGAGLASLLALARQRRRVRTQATGPEPG